MRQAGILSIRMIDIEKLSSYTSETMTAFAEYYSDLFSFYEISLTTDSKQGNNSFLYEYRTLSVMAALSSDRSLWNPVIHSYLLRYYITFNEHNEKEMQSFNRRFHDTTDGIEKSFLMFRLISQEIRTFLRKSDEPRDQELEKILRAVFENIPDVKNTALLAEIDIMNAVLQKIRYRFLTRKKEVSEKDVWVSLNFTRHKLYKSLEEITRLKGANQKPEENSDTVDPTQR